MTEIVPADRTRHEPRAGRRGPATKVRPRDPRGRGAAVAGCRVLDADAQEPAGHCGRRRADDLLPARAVRAVRRALSAGRDGSREVFPSAAEPALDPRRRQLQPASVRARHARHRHEQLHIRRRHIARAACEVLRARLCVRADGIHPVEHSPLRRRSAWADLSVRQRFVRARRVVAPAVRRADFADGRAGRHRDFVYARTAAGRSRGLLRRLHRYGHHAPDRAAAQHSVALSHHRASRGLPDGSAEPSGLPRHRGDSGVHRMGRPRTRHPRPGAVDAEERLRDGGRSARLRPAARHRASRAAEYDVVRDRGGHAVDSRLHPGRSDSVVSRRRRAGAERLVGQHAEPGAQHSRADVVPLAAVRSRHGHLRDRDGLQLPRRRPARRARSAQSERRRA